jgi:hypothetical protein
MISRAATGSLDVVQRVREGAATAARVVESLPLARVLGAFVAVEWILVLVTALVVRHAGWIYYQGGDQLWYYTLGWLLGHGELTQTLVGYVWSFVLAPVSWVAGPNLVSALPAIVLFQVLVLVPVAMLALYGIAARIGGKLFGYWALSLWLVLPFLGVLYTSQGYHQKYTELLLPQAFGLTAMSDLPATVATLVSVYFCARVLFDRNPRAVDAVAAGVAAGAAIGIKPASALFLVGPTIAFLVRRRLASIALFAAGLAPAVLTLVVWKARGLGSVPLLNGSAPTPDLASALPVGGLNLQRYLNQLNWSHLQNNIDLLREHFWSGRLLVWMMLAGVVALARRSLTAALLVGGWFFAFAIVKGSYAGASIEDGSLFRIMMPSYPAFVLMLAALPLLLPGVPGRLTAHVATRRLSFRSGWAAVGAAVLVTAVLPLAAIAVANPNRSDDRATLNATNMPVPANVSLGLTAKRVGDRVTLTWDDSRAAGGPVFYRIWRARTPGFTCPAQNGAALCNVTMPEVGVRRRHAFVDRPPRGRWNYRVAVAANWLNDPQYGDPYLVSRPVVVTIK